MYAVGAWKWTSCHSTLVHHNMFTCVDSLTICKLITTMHRNTVHSKQLKFYVKIKQNSLNITLFTNMASFEHVWCLACTQSIFQFIYFLRTFQKITDFNLSRCGNFGYKSVWMQKVISFNVKRLCVSKYFVWVKWNDAKLSTRSQSLVSIVGGIT